MHGAQTVASRPGAGRSHVSVAVAGKGEIRFVETDVDLRADGSAVVAYTVQWAVLSGELHGFYFQGNDRLRVGRVADDSFAVDSDGNRYGLSIDKVASDTWDIVLADGQGRRIRHRDLCLLLRDLVLRGRLSSRRPPPRTAASWWSSTGRPCSGTRRGNQDHYTLKVLLPHVLPDGVTPREYVGEGDLVLTEPWVNEQYLIDYQRGEEDRLRLVFHKERPGNRFHMRVQFYLPAEWFGLPDPSHQLPRRRRRGEPPRRCDEGAISDAGSSRSAGWSCSGLAFVVVAGKQRSMVTAHQGLADIGWDTLDWTPPRLILSSFRKPGKVCEDLTRLEAAFYLGIPFKRIVGGDAQLHGRRGLCRGRLGVAAEDRHHRRAGHEPLRPVRTAPLQRRWPTTASSIRPSSRS